MPDARLCANCDKKNGDGRVDATVKLVDLFHQSLQPRHMPKETTAIEINN